MYWRSATSRLNRDTLFQTFSCHAKQCWTPQLRNMYPVPRKPNFHHEIGITKNGPTRIVGVCMGKQLISGYETSALASSLPEQAWARARFWDFLPSICYQKLLGFRPSVWFIRTVSLCGFLLGSGPR